MNSSHRYDGMYVVNGAVYFVTEHVTMTEVRYKNKKWKVWKDSNHKKNMELVKLKICGLNEELKTLRIINKEKALILSEMLKDVFNKREIEFEFHSAQGSFTFYAKKILVKFATNEKEKILVSIETPRWSKNTSVITKAVAFAEKAAEECRD